MEIIASYEVKKQLSVTEDGRILVVNHPRGLYRAQIKNVRRRVFTSPFVLAVHLYYDAPELDSAREKGDDYCPFRGWLKTLAFRRSEGLSCRHATLSARRSHRDGFAGAPGLGAEVPQAGADRAGGDSGA